MRTSFAAAVLIAVILAMAGAAEAETDSKKLTRLYAADRRILNEHGATVILRGVAVNQLGGYFQANPDIPSTLPLGREDFERITALGLNSVRLIVTWDLLEPEPGQHDEAYLAKVKEAVGWARENEIYVILDMHQDAWGKHISSEPDEKCPPPYRPSIGWDGAPEWATLTDDLPDCNLRQRELSPSVERAWHSFWTNREGIQDRLIATWAWIAESFKNDTTVAGYDLLNEPNWGYSSIAVTLVHKPRFYRKAIEAIRRAEAGGIEKMVFFEPLALWSASPGEMPVRFTGDQNIVYAPHIYLGTITWDVFLFKRELIPLRLGFELAKRESAYYGATFWNGEWGPGPGDHPARHAALEDEYQIGSARWLWKCACGDPHRMNHYWPDTAARFSGDTGSVILINCDDPENPAGVEAGLNERDRLVLTRPYPRAFPSPTVYKSDMTARTLDLSGEAPAGNVPLEVWVPGEREPKIESRGIRDLAIRQVPGGWLVEGIPGPGGWSLTAAGSD